MVRTRFAPSPTGFLHLGSLRTAAYAYALARHESGQFFLRIEDTDQRREIRKAREKIYSTLKTFGLDWDGDPVIQSQRLKLYQNAAEKLVQSGHAYRKEGAIRLKIPKDETISFYDFVIRKEISWGSSQVPNPVLLKSDGFPTYHLAMPVDDHEMGISHVIRSVEWLPSTPIHILVFKYLGYDLPHIGHPSAILDSAGGKLSKRKGNVSVEQFLAEGYLPEALLNFVVLLGWAPKDNRELFTLDEFVRSFDISGFQKSNPKLNLDKLNWFNQQYLKSKSDTEVTQLVKPFVKSKLSNQKITQIIPLIKNRLTKLSEFDALSRFFVTPPSYDISLWSNPISTLDHLQFAAQNLDAILNGEIVDEIKSLGWKVGDFFMSLRVAICGSRATPPLTETMVILGRSQSASRIQSAIKFLRTRALS